MARPQGFFAWTTTVSPHMPHLRVPQAYVLALWSAGIALTRSCGRLTVATCLALQLGQQVDTVAQRLSACWCPASHTAGAKRPSVDGTTCCVPLLRWRGAWWTGTPLALALDATSWGVRWVVLPGRVV